MNIMDFGLDDGVVEGNRPVAIAYNLLRQNCIALDLCFLLDNFGRTQQTLLNSYPLG